MKKPIGGNGKKNIKPMTKAECEVLFQTLKNRFELYPDRHQNIVWSTVEARLRTLDSKVWSIAEMERTGGEPDVVAFDKKTDEFVFFDCAVESPKGRRSVCYDETARLTRKENRPEASALGMAAAMGVEILDETQYRMLQTLGVFDTKTSSWLKTPGTVRDLGGSLFGDRRYNQVFTYHNGADSYYAARGFRCSLRV